MGTLHEFMDKEGKRIRLTKERWKHIAREHPDIGGIDAIKETVMQPTVVRPSDRDPDGVKWLYRYVKKPKLYMLVSIKYLNCQRRRFHNHRPLREKNKMNQNNIHIHFDAEGDYLEIRFGPVKLSYDEYIGDDTFQRRDRETDDVLGYAFYNVKTRQTQKPSDIIVPMRQA